MNVMQYEIQTWRADEEKWQDLRLLSEVEAKAMPEGVARALLAVLRVRQIPLPDAARAYLMSERNSAEMLRWVKCAARATTISSVLPSHAFDESRVIEPNQPRYLEQIRIRIAAAKAGEEAEGAARAIFELARHLRRSGRPHSLPDEVAEVTAWTEREATINAISELLAMAQTVESRCRQSLWERVEKATAKGEADGFAQALFAVLHVRQVPVSDAEYEQVMAETDVARLERWVERAAVATPRTKLLAELSASLPIPDPSIT